MKAQKVRQDQVIQRTNGMVNALHHRINPRATLTHEGRAYCSMSLIEIARELYEMQGVNTRGLNRYELAGEVLHVRSSGLHVTSDFTSLLGNLARNRLRDAYEENPGSYSLWARRAPNALDFKPINAVRLSGAPSLMPVQEGGEYSYGTMRDGTETYSMLTYGRIIAFTREAMINDDLRAFDRLVQAFGTSARRLENRLVYSQIVDNPNMADGSPLFHADHGNLGSGVDSWLQMSSLSAGRTAMRTARGQKGELLNIAPAFLIVPAALEQTAYQLTSSQFTPATTSAINEFRQGGRSSLTPIVEPLLDETSATAWYLAAPNSAVDTVEYCYLEGAEGPTIETKESFNIDGVSFKCRLNFATKVIDRVGLYRSDGQ